jgi:hypothetical protein
MVDDAIKFVTDKSLSIEPELEKHKVDDAVTVDKKRDNTCVSIYIRHQRYYIEKSYLATSDLGKAH